MVYRPILRDAWKATWQHKSLWIFGIFAGLISTGGVVDVVFSGLQKATSTSSLLTQLLDRTFIGYAYASEFILYISRVNPTQVVAFITVGTIVSIGLIVCGVISQAALIHGSGHTNKHPHEIRKHVIPHFWDVFFVDVTTKIIFFILTALLTLAFFSSTLFWLHLYIFIPTVVILYILSILALCDVVESKSHALNAFETALKIFKTQWLATIEFGFLLFFILLIAIFVFLAALILLSIPFSLINTIVLIIGSPILFFIVNTLSALFVLALVLSFGGALVTFQYSSWRFFYKRAVHKSYGTKLFSKLWRMMTE